MKQEFETKSNKKTLIIVGAIVASVVMLFVGREIYLNMTVKRACVKATKEYTKALDKASRDIEKSLRNFKY